MSAAAYSDRVLIARAAAHTRWAKTADTTAALAPARKGLEAKFEREADPEGVLPPEERRRRAAHLRTAHMQRLALRSAQVRRERKGRAA